jgi:hypothetical protein
VATLRLFESRRVAALATALYAVWPAGVAMASVVGTDVPAAALVVCALAVLATLGPARPWRAAVLFGVVMGLAAWVRAVALPLAPLSLGYWLARRTRLPATLALTAGALAATLLVLSPWAWRQARISGHVSFTDDHGGLTALIGANPNSEGTYTRALNQMFHDLTGKSVLDQPHRDVDQAAYALAKDWARFEPAYALGLATKRAERLFDSERYLLYWPLFRPGVLVGPRAAWFAARREALSAAADLFGAVLAGLAVAGVVLAATRKRGAALVLVPFQLALAATYVVFFAEPRYRLPIELLALPFAALCLVELASLAAAIARGAWASVRAGGLRVAVAAVVVVTGAWALPALAAGGAELRARHRWAADVWRVDGVARLAKWRAVNPRRLSSGVAGGAGGVRLGGDGAHETVAMVELAPLPGGTWVLELDVTAVAPPSTSIAAESPVRLRVATEAGALLADVAVPAGAPLHVVTALVHPGGEPRLVLTATSATAATVLINDSRLEREPLPDPAPRGS